MAFRLRKGEPAVAGIRRLLLADIAAARSDLAAPAWPQARSVHRLRRRLRRDRALLRVLEPATAAAREARRHLRDAGRALAGLREATTLAALARDLATDLPAGAAPSVRRAKGGAPDGGAARRRAATSIRAAATLLARLPAAGPDDLLGDAVGRALRRARRTGRQAKRTGATADLHEWRKRLKELAQMLEAAEPLLKGGRRLARTASRIAALLGSDHDLAVLAERTGDGGDEWRHAMSRRRKHLQKEALRRAGKLRSAKTPSLRKATS